MSRPPIPPSPEKKKRLALFDNIKGLLIILVVFGHMMFPIHNDNPALSACFDITYLFHMPLFVLLSGLFAKSTYRDGRLNIDRIISFAVLGVIFQAALLAVNGAAITPLSLLRFPSAPWYLVSMAWWSALTPLLHKLGFARGMLSALAVCMLGGLFDFEGGFLAISRTIAFLPWFALGYYLKPQQIEALKRQRSLWVAVAFGAIIVGIRIAIPAAYAWFFPMVYGDNPYTSGLVFGIIQKLTSIGFALIMSLAAIKLIPSKDSPLTTLGKRTLQIYILHRLIRAALTFRTPFYEIPILTDPLFGLTAIVILTALTIAICSARIFEAPFNNLLRISWLKRQGSDANENSKASA